LGLALLLLEPEIVLVLLKLLLLDGFIELKSWRHLSMMFLILFINWNILRKLFAHQKLIFLPLKLLVLKLETSFLIES
jgi:hypothetical protein